MKREREREREREGGGGVGGDEERLGERREEGVREGQ